jgi:hypothetical protein
VYKRQVQGTLALERQLRKLELKFTGDITDDLQRICECNVTADVMRIAINNPFDWRFDVQAVCEGYIEHEEKIFRDVLFNDLNDEVIAMQKRVREAVNSKHLLRVVWYARIARKGETLDE